MDFSGFAPALNQMSIHSKNSRPLRTFWYMKLAVGRHRSVTPLNMRIICPKLQHYIEIVVYTHRIEDGFEVNSERRNPGAPDIAALVYKGYSVSNIAI